MKEEGAEANMNGAWKKEKLETEMSMKITL